MKSEHYKAMIGGKAYIIQDSDEYSYAAGVNNNEDRIIYAINEDSNKYTIECWIENPSDHTKYLINNGDCYIALSYRRTNQWYKHNGSRSVYHPKWTRMEATQITNLSQIVTLYASKNPGNYKEIDYIDFAANADHKNPRRDYLFVKIKPVLISHGPYSYMPCSRVYSTNSQIVELELQSEYL